MYTKREIVKYAITILIIILIIFLILLRPISGNQNSMSAQDNKKIAENKIISIKGIDVSHYQGKINWSKVLTHNIGFVYIKATEGITYTDPMFIKNQNELFKNKILYGSYHFFDPKDDPLTQAENYLSKIKRHNKMLVPVLDIEIRQGVAKEKLVKNVQLWLEKVTESLGCKPIIYSYTSFYAEYLESDFKNYPIWIADYTKKPTLRDTSKFIMWQHSQKGNISGIEAMVDENIFFGDHCRLKSFICN